jgi:hypothetical protein
MADRETVWRVAVCAFLKHMADNQLALGDDHQSKDLGILCFSIKSVRAYVIAPPTTFIA